MFSYKIGSLIKALRKDKGLTAEDLAFEAGCDVTTISRIENNKYEPRPRVYEAIMEKLGYNPRTEFEIWSMSRDFKSYRAIKELNHLLCQKNFKEAEAYISVLKKEKSFSKGLNRQFILSAIVTIMSVNAEEPASIISLATEAINITINPFNEKHIDQYFLSYDEIALINKLGLAYADLCGYDKAIEILSLLKASIEKSFVDEGEKAKTYPMVISNLTKYLGLSNRHEEVIELCIIARSMCIRQNKLRSLPDILVNYAYALHYTGNLDDSKKYANQAYELYNVMDRHREANHTKKHVKENLNIDL